MNKRIVLLMCSCLLVSSVPIPVATAGTVADTPTSESTLPSMADELMNENTPTTPIVEEPSESDEVADTSEKSITEGSSTIQPFGGGEVGPQTTFLIEGSPGDPSYDIDADFARTLRTEYRVTNGGSSGNWSGRYKSANQLTEEDMLNLIDIDLSGIGITVTNFKGIDYAKNLTGLRVDGKNITNELDVSSLTKLQTLIVQGCNLTELDISQNIMLNRLNILNCTIATELDTSHNSELNNFGLTGSPSIEIDISQNRLIEILAIQDCNLTSQKLAEELDLENRPNLRILILSDNQLTTLDLSKNINLMQLLIQNNKISSINLEGLNQLWMLYASNNLIKNIDFSSCEKLSKVQIANNQISDISSAYGLNYLTNLDASNQEIEVARPRITNSTGIVDVLKTTNGLGLTATSSDIIPTPTFSYDGDKIILDNITKNSTRDKSIQFQYDGNQLAEGAASGNKIFSGNIQLYKASYLSDQLTSDKKKIDDGETISWTWTIDNKSGDITAKNIKSKLSLPTGLDVVTGSIKVNGQVVADNYFDNEILLPNLDEDEEHIITFDTVGYGKGDQWLTIKTISTWQDDSGFPSIPIENEGSIQIKDDEQTYIPKDTMDLAILSMPKRFFYNYRSISQTVSSHRLREKEYMTNTNAINNGFYARIKDERAVSTGWKLTVALSDFKDTQSNLMPNGTGASLDLSNMTVQSVTNRDTPNEAIDSSPSTGVPSVVENSTKIVSGQTAQIVMKAQPLEGQGTWQLRIPFNDVELNLPANAGTVGELYSANLTWSLDNTP